MNKIVVITAVSEHHVHVESEDGSINLLFSRDSHFDDVLAGRECVRVFSRIELVGQDVIITPINEVGS